MSIFKFYNKDCLDVLKEMKSESIDLIITSPPYCMGKAYEDPGNDIETFKNIHLRIIKEIYRVVKKKGMFVGRLDIMYMMVWWFR